MHSAVAPPTWPLNMEAWSAARRTVNRLNMYAVGKLEILSHFEVNRFIQQRNEEQEQEPGTRGH